MVTDFERRKEFSTLFEEIGKSLDITEKQYELVVKRYNAVGAFLADQDSVLAPYKPEVLPQGSFMLGTMIRPIHDDDELDIDLVCKLEGKNPSWTQYDLKKAIGDRLKSSGIYGPLLDEEGRRCWTLQYAEQAKFHLDILPAIVGKNYKMILEKALSSRQISQIGNLAIKITDKEIDNYRTDPKPENWMTSNPFGYATWFADKADISTLSKSVNLREAVQPVPAFTKEKLPLVRIVQILKRHRDIMFEGHEDKPISIAITTLASNAYNKEVDLMDGLINVVNKMETFIIDKADERTGKAIKWIENPINPEEENFADKWVDNPNKQRNFYAWLRKIKNDINVVSLEKGLKIKEVLEEPFGKSLIVEAYNNYGESKRIIRESGNFYMSSNTGILGTASTSVPVKNHKFYGEGKN